MTLTDADRHDPVNAPFQGERGSGTLLNRGRTG